MVLFGVLFYVNVTNYMMFKDINKGMFLLLATVQKWGGASGVT